MATDVTRATGRANASSATRAGGWPSLLSAYGTGRLTSRFQGLLSWLTLRTALWLCLGIAECILAAATFDLQALVPPAARTVLYPLGLLRWMLVSAPILLLLVWSSRGAIGALWRAEQERHPAFAPFAVNLALLALLLASGPLLSRAVAAGQPASGGAILAYLLLLAAVACSWARIDIPLSAMSDVARLAGWRIPVAAALGLASLLMSEVILSSGPAIAADYLDLAYATWLLSGALLAIFEPTLIVDAAARTLTIGNFTVEVVESCAGYEGMALMTAFVGLYLILLRKSLRFPFALLLFPVGWASIWLLNSARIAALAGIGAHLSPETAIRGFHSRAGWLIFLAVCAATLWAVPRTLLWKRTLPAVPVGDPNKPNAKTRSDSLTEAHLVPFIVMMAGMMLVSSAVPYDRPLYPLAIGASLIALLWSAGRLSLRRLDVSAPAAIVGALVGVAWIATEPATVPDPAGLGAWLAALSPAVAALWLTVRALGAVVIVPIVEELAFRSFLYRRLISSDFEHVAMTRLSLVALVVSSLLFGCLHDRWLAAALAGAAYALVMLHRGRLGDAILAHGISNAMIFAWALAFRQWSLI
ncbi:MAG: exosortase E/protease, VPEID-CTERM system [Hyphomicrobiaceae bacterium]